jgi:hypothetical protein
LLNVQYAIKRGRKMSVLNEQDELQAILEVKVTGMREDLARKFVRRTAACIARPYIRTAKVNTIAGTELRATPEDLASLGAIFAKSSSIINPPIQFDPSGKPVGFAPSRLVNETLNAAATATDNLTIFEAVDWLGDRNRDSYTPYHDFTGDTLIPQNHTIFQPGNPNTLARWKEAATAFRNLRGTLPSQPPNQFQHFLNLTARMYDYLYVQLCAWALYDAAHNHTSNSELTTYWKTHFLPQFLNPTDRQTLQGILVDPIQEAEKFKTHLETYMNDPPPPQWILSGCGKQKLRGKLGQDYVVGRVFQILRNNLYAAQATVQDKTLLKKRPEWSNPNIAYDTLLKQCEDELLFYAEPSSEEVVTEQKEALYVARLDSVLLRQHKDIALEAVSSFLKGEKRPPYEFAKKLHELLTEH